ncbi:MAG: Holliday junction branch migration protein RuvA [Kiritimatiellae bacterium]|nr:Holliday junction branch migration protein RuvA [Kiritimatiellia bacterium]
MIAYLRGILDSKTPAAAVVDCGGVGWECLIPLSTYDRLPATGCDVKLLTSHVVREDAEILYGFATESEKQTFELITSVSGVGPKLALAILSGLTVGDLQLAIADGNAKRLAAVKGIGKKTAERIVVELRDKVNPIEALANGKAAEGDDAKAGILRDAMLALAALGFSDDTARQQVQRVLEEDPSVSSTETIIRRALAAK